MNTGAKELKSILEELDELKLPHMAAELETLYKQPAFVDTGRLVRGKMILPSHLNHFADLSKMV